MTLREYTVITYDRAARLVTVDMQMASYVRGVRMDEEQQGIGCVLVIDGRELPLREAYIDVREDFKQAACEATAPNLVC